MKGNTRSRRGYSGGRDRGNEKRKVEYIIVLVV